MNKTKKVAFAAIMSALYVCLSMAVKIPVIGHISLDLGYIAFAVACYFGGPLIGAACGAIGCIIVSTISSGLFPIGWAAGNALIGAICGIIYKKRGNLICTVATIVSIFLGVGVVKTAVECSLYGIPLAVKVPKNMIAFTMDSVVMVGGYYVAKVVDKRLGAGK